MGLLLRRYSWILWKWCRPLNVRFWNPFIQSRNNIRLVISNMDIKKDVLKLGRWCTRIKARIEGKKQWRAKEELKGFHQNKNYALNDITEQCDSILEYLLIIIYFVGTIYGKEIWGGKQRIVAYRCVHLLWGIESSVWQTSWKRYMESTSCWLWLVNFNIISHYSLVNKLWKYKSERKHWEQQSSMHMGKTVSGVALSVCHH